MDDLMLTLPGLSPVCGKSGVARFDGGCLSSDAGVLVLREIEQRMGVAERLAGCIDDPRAQAQVVHGLADMIRFRMLMISSDYEDGNDATAMRSDPAFKLAQDVLPSGPDLASQPTLSRLENWPDLRALLRMGKALINLYCASYARVPKRIVLDFDDTFDAVHGGQQLRLFNAHYDEYGFQPIVVFDGDGRFVTAMLRPAKRPSGVEIQKLLRRLLRAIRANWPATHILIRADSHYCCPEVIDFCRANGLDFILGVAPTTTLRRHVKALGASAKAYFEAGPKKAKVRRFKEFTTAPRVGAASNASLRASKRAKREPTPGLSSPISQAAGRRRSTRTFIAGAAARKITSNPGRPISPPTARPAARRPPISFACSCMPGPTGCSGPCAPPCQSARPGGSRSSIRCAFDWLRSRRAWSN